MVNHTKFNTDANYSDVYLRQVIIGMLGFLRNRFNWLNVSDENGVYNVKIPIHYSLTGNKRYIFDAFYDDIPNTRVNMNTDTVPRGALELVSWEAKLDEFSNPNVWVNRNVEIDDELKAIISQIKSVPLKLEFKLTTVLDNEIDVFKMWQTYMENMFMYKYIRFDYKKLPINGVFNFSGDTSNPIKRDGNFGGDKDLILTEYTIDIHTFFPIFDDQNKVDQNEQIQFIMNTWNASGIDGINLNNTQESDC